MCRHGHWSVAYLTDGVNDIITGPAKQVLQPRPLSLYSSLITSVQRMAQSHLAATLLQALQRVFKKYNFLPNDDPLLPLDPAHMLHRHDKPRKPRVCVQNFAAKRCTVSGTQSYPVRTVRRLSVII